MKFHEKLEKLRETRGVSVPTVAKAAGTTRSITYRWFNGQSKPTIEDALKLARYFGISLDYLMDEEELVPRSPLGLTPEETTLLITWKSTGLPFPEVIKRLTVLAPTEKPPVVTPSEWALIGTFRALRIPVEQANERLQTAVALGSARTPSPAPARIVGK